MDEHAIEPFFSEVLRIMAQELLTSIPAKQAENLIRLIVPNGHPVLNGNGPNDYLCPGCRTVLIRGAEPIHFPAKALVLICDCGTYCVTAAIENF